MVLLLHTNVCTCKPPTSNNKGTRKLRVLERDKCRDKKNQNPETECKMPFCNASHCSSMRGGPTQLCMHSPEFIPPLYVVLAGCPHPIFASPSMVQVPLTALGRRPRPRRIDRRTERLCPEQDCRNIGKRTSDRGCARTAPDTVVHLFVQSLARRDHMSRSLLDLPPVFAL